MRARFALAMLCAVLCAVRVAALDFYRELGLRRGASQQDIKAAYRELAKKFHPDKNKDENAPKRFQRIASAYETLSDPDKRRSYDLHGDDYANVQQQQAQQQAHRQQQEQFFEAFGGRGRRQQQQQGPPIFSSTQWLDATTYRDLVEDSQESWLIQFYHDGNEACKEFAPRWEALAAKLPPMVRLARINIDQNYGLVQRYRSFVRCRQNAFFMECTAPALVLVTPSTDGNTQAEAYRGHHHAEHVYDWVKRSLPEARRPAVGVTANPPPDFLRAYLAPPWRAKRARRPARLEEMGRGRQPAKGLLFSSRPIADSLYARHLAQQMSATLHLTAVQVEGGLGASTAAAALARQAGVTELPAVAIWNEVEEVGGDARPPKVFAVGSSPDALARDALLVQLRRAAVPPVPVLGAANYHDTCSPAGWDDEARYCVLLVVPLKEDGSWPAAAVSLLALLRTEASGPDSSGVRFAWLDGRRQDPFARHVVGAAAGCAGAAAAAGAPGGGGVGGGTKPCEAGRALPTSLVGLTGQAATGLRSLRVARLPLAAAAAAPPPLAELRAWLRELRSTARSVTPGSAAGWRKMRQPPPPLRADAPPSARARLVAWFWAWGWGLVGALVGGAALGALYLPQLKAQAKAAEAKAKAAKAAAAAPPAATPPRAESAARAAAGAAAGAAAFEGASPRARPAPAAANPEAAGVLVLSAATLGAVLERASYQLVFVMNAGVVDRGTIRALAAHFAETFGEGGAEWRQWSVCLLDYAAEAGRDPKPPLMHALLPSLRTSPVAVIRKGQKLAAFQGQVSSRLVDEWLGALKMGEVSWVALE